MLGADSGNTQASHCDPPTPQPQSTRPNYDYTSLNRHLYCRRDNTQSMERQSREEPLICRRAYRRCRSCGIGSACQLRRKSPELSFTVLEARAVSGGTWDLFRYPGIRSDSDMYTYSYGFKPWVKNLPSLTATPFLSTFVKRQTSMTSIDISATTTRSCQLSGLQLTIFGQLPLLVPTLNPINEEPLIIRCRFILSCSGYYDYDQGYTPEFAGIDDFQGEIVHPQHWPEQLDYKNKRVVVIGSGATAVTLVPTMSEDTASLVMLQRSPTYIANVPGEDPWLKPLISFCLLVGYFV